MAQMTPQTTSIDDVLVVLAITVIIDQKILHPELSEFKVQAAGLAPLTGHQISEEDAQKWFTSKRATILDQMSSRGRNTVILKSLTRVKDAVIRENLYDSMIAISVSDAEYHRQESDLIRSAAVIWGYSRPPFKVSEA